MVSTTINQISWFVPFLLFDACPFRARTSDWRKHHTSTWNDCRDLCCALPRLSALITAPRAKVFYFLRPEPGRCHPSQAGSPAWCQGFLPGYELEDRCVLAGSMGKLTVSDSIFFFLGSCSAFVHLFTELGVFRREI